MKKLRFKADVEIEVPDSWKIVPEEEQVPHFIDGDGKRLSLGISLMEWKKCNDGGWTGKELDGFDDIVQPIAVTCRAKYQYMMDGKTTTHECEAVY